MSYTVEPKWGDHELLGTKNIFTAHGILLLGEREGLTSAILGSKPLPFLCQRVGGSKQAFGESFQGSHSPVVAVA